MRLHLLYTLSIFYNIQLTYSNNKKDVNKASLDLLEKEAAKLKKDGIKCSLKTISRTAVERLYFADKISESLRCLIKKLEEERTVGWAWSFLGHLLQNAKSKYSSKSSATTAFKQATKLNGKLEKFVKEWSFLGPFVIGKLEIDGDPIASLGGIQEVAKSRQQKNVKFYSELVEKGVVNWSVYKQKSPEESIQIQPQINWNDLVNSLGSLAITEWQGWLVGNFFINENNQNILIQCLGVAIVWVDNTPITGDLYQRKQFQFAIKLERGLHNLYVPLRAKAVQTLQCSIKSSPSSFEILTPNFLPDLVDGYIFSDYISLTIINQQSNKWLKNIKVSLEDQSQGEPLKIQQLNDKRFHIAPGQTRPVTFRIVSVSTDHVIPTCSDLELKVKVTTSDGQNIFPLKLRCRKSSESFIFTFQDHDGSVQHGAAIKPIKGCPGREDDTCPTLLTLHGTTVPPQNQADSYKRMEDGNYVFGVDNAWTLAPTRHGAHNWEGPGALTAITALETLAKLTQEKEWIKYKSSAQQVIFAGHSMGGHGAWHLATHFPDRALGLVTLAGWIKKEEYGDSNLFFRHDISTSHVDPSVKAVLEACIAENDVDRHVTNLKDVPVLARIGGADRTVHPYFVRRMYRLLMETNISATYNELAGKEHWWWDTKEPNDGGAVNDPQLRKFMTSHAQQPIKQCQDKDENCDDNKLNKYSQRANVDDEFTYTVMNPAFGEGMRGIKVMQQIVPYRTSTVKGFVDAKGDMALKTVNVMAMQFYLPPNRASDWTGKRLEVDGSHITNVKLGVNYCLSQDRWHECKESDLQRGPSTLGPSRRVAESPFLIVVGSQGSVETRQAILEFAVYIANQFYLTSDTLAPIVQDADLSTSVADGYNLIVLGGPTENTYALQFIDQLPIQVDDSGIKIASCRYETSRTGALILAPHSNHHLALLLLGNTIEGLSDVVTLATPTIPPMARSPFSNLVPDFVITGPEFRAKGPGGYLCVGHWGNRWDFRPELSSCAHC